MTNNDNGSVKRFGYQWKRYDRIILEYEVQFLKWIFPLRKEDFKNKIILDAGCGIGRNSFWPLKYNAKEVVAFDYSKETVAIAKKNLAYFSNCDVVYKSIYDIDYSKKFDIVFSIGVIHHLEDPKKAVSMLTQAAKDGGTVLIWVYGYESNEWIVHFINPLRKLTCRMPLFLVHFLSYCFSVPLYIYLKIFSQKQLYLKQILEFPFRNIHCIVFDQLIPKTAHYWRKDEAMSLFSGLGLKDIKAYNVNNNSWTIVGKK